MHISRVRTTSKSICSFYCQYESTECNLFKCKFFAQQALERVRNNWNFFKYCAMFEQFTSIYNLHHKKIVISSLFVAPFYLFLYFSSSSSLLLFEYSASISSMSYYVGDETRTKMGEKIFTKIPFQLCIFSINLHTHVLLFHYFLLFKIYFLGSTSRVSIHTNVLFMSFRWEKNTQLQLSLWKMKSLPALCQ